MIKATQIRRRRTDASALSRGASSGGAPSGPAGGDLAGVYPNPTVVGLSHVTAGGDLAGTMDAPTIADGVIVNSMVSDSAAIIGTKILSDFGAQPITTNGLYLDGNIGTIAAQVNPLLLEDESGNNYIQLNTGGNNQYGTQGQHVFLGGSLYGDASALFNIPPPPTLSSGNGYLDSTGLLVITPPGNPANVVACWGASGGVAGQLYTNDNEDGTFNIASFAGSADGNLPVNWIAF